MTKDKLREWLKGWSAQLSDEPDRKREMIYDNYLWWAKDAERQRRLGEEPAWNMPTIDSLKECLNIDPAFDRAYLRYNKEIN